MPCLTSVSLRLLKNKVDHSNLLYMLEKISKKVNSSLNVWSERRMIQIRNLIKSNLLQKL